MRIDYFAETSTGAEAAELDTKREEIKSLNAATEIQRNLLRQEYAGRICCPGEEVHWTAGQQLCEQ